MPLRARCALQLVKGACCSGDTWLRPAQSVSYATASAAKDKKKSGKQREAEYTGDSKANVLLKLLQPEKVDRRMLSPEQLAEYEEKAKEYSRQKMAFHRAWQRDMNGKIALMQAAIAALPPHLREMALIEDETPFPADRMMFTHTPPIPDYQLEEQQEVVVGDDQFKKR